MAAAEIVHEKQNCRTKPLIFNMASLSIQHDHDNNILNTISQATTEKVAKTHMGAEIRFFFGVFVLLIWLRRRPHAFVPMSPYGRRFRVVCILSHSEASMAF